MWTMATLNAISSLANVRYMPMIRLVQTNTGPASIATALRGIRANHRTAALTSSPPTPARSGSSATSRTVVCCKTTSMHILRHRLPRSLPSDRNQDPTAKIIAGSIVQATEIRLQYLDMVLEAYRTRYGVLMPVDVGAAQLHPQRGQLRPFPGERMLGRGHPARHRRRSGMRPGARERQLRPLQTAASCAFANGWWTAAMAARRSIFLNTACSCPTFAPPDDFPPERGTPL